jgi:hypothetical protein
MNENDECTHESAFIRHSQWRDDEGAIIVATWCARCGEELAEEEQA